MKNIKNTRSAVCLLAGELIKKHGYDQPDAMRTAWREIKGGDLVILAAVKTNGTKYRRVVSTNLAYMPPRTGTGRPAPEGLRLFIDWAKKINGKRSVISTYNYKITAL